MGARARSDGRERCGGQDHAGRGPLRTGDPAQLGAYETLGRLGAGGQGAVFLARPVGAGADADGAPAYVAIKLLHAGLTADDAARARFVRELEVAKRVARFCTAQIIDADVAGDQPYIVSEFVEGSSLYHLVKLEGPRSGGTLERLAISTLTALTAIHRAGIVHRDFKPQNVLLGPDGPRVIDFGVARALGAAGETQNVGTPAYMAPEQFEGKGLGPAADLFAWGTTMVFAATGRPAFGNDEVGAVMHRIMTGEPDLRGLPSPLREVVADCLAKRPDRRPTARRAQERLVGASDDEDLGAQEPDHPAAPAAAYAGPGPADHPPEPAGHPPEPAGHRPGPASAPPPAAPPPYGPHPPPPGQQHHQGPLPPTTPGRPGGGRRRGLLPLVAAAAAVDALLIGGSVWATTALVGGEDAGREAAAGDAGAEQGGAPGQPADPGSDGRNENGGGERGGSSAPQAGPGVPAPTTAQPGRTRRPGPGAPPGKGGGGPEPPNPYNPQQVCDSGGHGGGYYVQRSTAFSHGTVFQLYNSSGYNCAVTMKTVNIGRGTAVWTRIQRKDGRSAGDSGSFKYYAGPAFIYAKGQCVRYSGGAGGDSAAASWGNCG